MAITLAEPRPLAPRALLAPRSRIVVGTLPLPVDLLLYQGDDFLMTLEVTEPDGTPFDLTGVDADAQIRVTPPSPNVLATFEIWIEENIIYLMLRHTETNDLPAASVWDCQITEPSNWITTLVAGRVMTTAQVTR